MDKEQTLQKMLPEQIFQILKASGMEMNKIQEIRLNVGQPLLLQYDGEEICLDAQGKRVRELKRAHRITESQVKETFEFMCCHSVYAYEEEIRQGFLTVEGGHRIGIAGQAVWEHGKIRQLKYISALNIRLASEKIGSAQEVLKELYQQGIFCHTLLLGPPRCGKTTLLRDCIRLLSEGNKGQAGVRVGVVDERGEIASCYHGVPQNDLGSRTDVLDRFPKSQGISMLIRTMSPAVIAVDEIGTREDMDALMEASLSGCRILATIHGTDMEEVFMRPMLSGISLEKFFQRFVVLTQEEPGKIHGIYNAKREKLW